jgi:hypothetical protein
MAASLLFGKSKHLLPPGVTAIVIGGEELPKFRK